MMVFAHIHTGPVHGGRISSRDGTRVVQLIRSPHMKWTERRGPHSKYEIYAEGDGTLNVYLKGGRGEPNPTGFNLKIFRSGGS